MLKILTKTSITLISLFVYLFVFQIPQNAQTGSASAGTGQIPASSETEGTMGVARIVDVKEKDVKDGSIVSSSDKGAILSNFPYDSQVLGIVARDAAIIFNSSGTVGLPVIANGIVYALVSTRDGNIKKGDLLATSTIPGVAVKALKSGYVLGTSLEDYSNSNKTQVEKIAINLDLHYFNSKPTFPGTLSDLFKFAVLPTKDGPTPLFKYIVAALVVIGSFILGFLTFGRTAAKGVEALGRNPAASKIIHLGIIINVSIVFLIVFTGLVVAFLILRL